MKKFVFTLGTLLDVKEKLEKEKRNQLAIVTRDLSLLKADLATMEANFSLQKEDFNSHLKKGYSAMEARIYSDYFTALIDDIKQQKQNIINKTLELQTCRDQLVALMKDIKILQNLKETQYQAYLEEVRKDEEKAINDLLSYKIITRT